jgi:hypothetical protein
MERDPARRLSEDWAEALKAQWNRVSGAEWSPDVDRSLFSAMSEQLRSWVPDGTDAFVLKSRDEPATVAALLEGALFVFGCDRIEETDESPKIRCRRIPLQPARARVEFYAQRAMYEDAVIIEYEWKFDLGSPADAVTFIARYREEQDFAQRLSEALGWVWPAPEQP